MFGLLVDCGNIIMFQLLTATLDGCHQTCWHSIMHSFSSTAIILTMNVSSQPDQPFQFDVKYSYGTSQMVSKILQYLATLDRDFSNKTLQLGETVYLVHCLIIYLLIFHAFIKAMIFLYVCMLLFCVFLYTVVLLYCCIVCVCCIVYIVHCACCCCICGWIVYVFAAQFVPLARRKDYG